MKDRTRLSTLATFAVAVMALATVVVSRHGHQHVARGPADDIVNQPVVTAPPLAPADAARTDSSVMGGPPASGHATR